MIVITRREGEEIVVGNPTNPIGVIKVATIKSPGETSRAPGPTLAVVRDTSLVDDDIYDELLQRLAAVATSQGAAGLDDYRSGGSGEARVRLAFFFPRDVDVHRREVADQLMVDNPKIIGSIHPGRGGCRVSSKTETVTKPAPKPPSSFHIDLFGTCVPVSPRPRSQNRDDPETWRDVGRRVNRRLMSICVGLPNLVDTIVRKAGSLIDGVAELPSAAVDRIRPRPSGATESQVDGAEAQLKQILEKMADRGIRPSLHELEDGRLVLILTGEDASTRKIIDQTRELMGLWDGDDSRNGPSEHSGESGQTVRT